MDLLAIIALAWLLNHAWDHARAARGASRDQRVQSAEQASGKPMSPAKRKSVAAQHDIGWWSSEIAHGAPVHRTGFHAAWLAHKAEAVQARARREEARTTHAEVASSFGQAIREHRARRAAIAAEIDQKLTDPAGGKEAVRQAAATVLPFSRQQAPVPQPAAAPVPAAPRPAPVMGPFAPAPVTRNDVKPAPQPDEGKDMPAVSAPAEMTYDQSVRMADEIMRHCDVELARLHAQQISSKVEMLAAASVDGHTLGHLADVDDATRKQIQAVQEQHDSAQAFKSALISTHGQGAEYHHSTAGGGAEKSFLQE